MKTLKSWIQSRPVTVACLTTGILGAALAELALVDAIYLAMGEPFDGWLVAFHVVLFIAIPVMLWQVAGLFKSTALLVALSLLFAGVPARAAEPQPAPALVIAGAAVLIIGGVIGCRIVKKCNKIARGRTNAWPEELRFEVAGGTDEYGAAFMWQESGYCLAERLLPVTPTVFTLDIAVQSVSNTTVTVSASTGHEFVQSWAELQEELEGHGLSVATGHHFSRNRQPCDAELVPISFDFARRIVRCGSGGVLVTIERSTDLREWEKLMALDVEAGGKPLKIEDVSNGGQSFYRVTTSK